MNKGKETEKLLNWHYKTGYTSEDSDDPTVKQERAIRQYKRGKEETHGKDSVYLQKRDILPFEILMLEKLGGRYILEQHCGKKLPKRL